MKTLRKPQAASQYLLYNHHAAYAYAIACSGVRKLVWACMFLSPFQRGGLDKGLIARAARMGSSFRQPHFEESTAICHPVTVAQITVHPTP